MPGRKRGETSHAAIERLLAAIEAKPGRLRDWGLDLENNRCGSVVFSLDDFFLHSGSLTANDRFRPRLKTGPDSKQSFSKASFKSITCDLARYRQRLTISRWERKLPTRGTQALGPAKWDRRKDWRPRLLVLVAGNPALTVGPKLGQNRPGRMRRVWLNEFRGRAPGTSLKRPRRTSDGWEQPGRKARERDRQWRRKIAWPGRCAIGLLPLAPGVDAGKKSEFLRTARRRWRRARPGAVSTGTRNLRSTFRHSPCRTDRQNPLGPFVLVEQCFLVVRLTVPFMLRQTFVTDDENRLPARWLRTRLRGR